MYDQAKPVVIEAAKIGHVPALQIDLQAVPQGHRSVSIQLARRVVENRDPRAGRCKDRCLLPACSSQAQELQSMHSGIPVRRDVLVRSQAYGPAAMAGRIDLLR